MGYGAISYEPFVSLQAHLRIKEAKEIEGKFEETPLQVECEFEVLGYEEQDDDDEASIEWTFRDWLAFSFNKHTEEIGISTSPKSKLRQVIIHTLGQEVIDKGTFEAEMLKGKEIRARVVRSGKNEDGDHSRIKAETIMGPPKKGKLNEVKPEEVVGLSDEELADAPF